jgi:hypothetical protein
MIFEQKASQTSSAERQRERQTHRRPFQSPLRTMGFHENGQFPLTGNGTFSDFYFIIHRRIEGETAKAKKIRIKNFHSVNFHIFHANIFLYFRFFSFSFEIYFYDENHFCRLRKS